METAIPSTRSSTALVLAPRGRDAAVAASLLREAGAATTICADLQAFERALGDDVCLAVVTEEALRSADLRFAAAWAEAQPSWSDLPFIILTERGGGPERNPGAARLSEALGNVTFMERPFHPTTFVSVARSAIKGRNRQYEARARIEQLHDSEERLRTALLAGRLGPWELDLATLALTASETCRAVFGRRADEPFTYADLTAGIHADDQQRVRAVLRASILRGEDCAAEFQFVWPDGAVHWVEIRAHVVHDRKGRRSRLVGVCSDITERKTAEERQRHLNETLEDRVAERTAELRQAHQARLEEIEQRQRAEEQLRQAQKMEIVGQLTGGVAHDFNNLLMAVLGNLELLRKHLPGDPKAARLIDRALEAAWRGASLTQRLLAFARRQDLNIEPRSLTDLVEGMADLLQRSVGAHIDLHTELPASLPLALVDANQLELAVLNLAINARDAMPAGGVLSISVDHVRSALMAGGPVADYLRVTVADTGHGMDADTLGRAAEPFFSTKELGKGTGLGLSMVHGLAVQLGGTLRLASEVGRGTTAELWLPATVAAAAERPEAPPVAHETAPKATILVVDDDALIAMSTGDMLEDLGHDVITVESGATALEILRNGQDVDLMITDYSMPKMTGAQLAVAARELRPALPILLATGYAELPKGTSLDLPRLGKPYQQAQLAAEVGRMLRARPA